jgi:hypothetical protein
MGDGPGTRGRWLNVRLRSLQKRLGELGHRASLPVIRRLLRAKDYRLRLNVKRREGVRSAERDRQFRYLRRLRRLFQKRGQPVLSVDTKKKELIGEFKNGGRAWGKEPEEVNVHDFPSQAQGRAVPYGVYDVINNVGDVYVGLSKDTPAFAADNLAAWCEQEMPQRFAGATDLLVHADCGGSNGYHCGLWKQQLQEKVADRFGLRVTVCHYPTGCSKWNPIEHRLFSQISKAWAGCPLRSVETMLHYIDATGTQTGLRVQAHRNEREYQDGQKVSDAEMQRWAIRRHRVCPQWNYTIYPRGEPAPS